MLAPLVVVQWLCLVGLVLSVHHNGWLFYQGGDQTFYYSSSYVVAHGHIPESSIGFGWSYLLAPFALVAGPSIFIALPAIILLQTIVLLPIALLCVYGIAVRIGGRGIGYLAALLWVVAPYAAIPLFDPRYHQKYVEAFLPQALGLSGLGDFPSMVCLLVSAYFIVRMLDTRAWVDGALAGLAAGFAMGIKPANALFLAGPALAFLLAPRWRPILAFAVTLAPSLVALALWKGRGLGHVPLLSAPAGWRVAAGAALPVAGVGHYLHLNWHQFRANQDELREFFYSVRVVQWLPLGGLVAVARLSWPKAGLLAGWFGAFALVKGSSTAASIQEGTFFRLFMPGFPPFLLFVATIPLLVPQFGPRLTERLPAPSLRPLRWRSAAVVTAAAVFGLVPPMLMAALTSNPHRAPAKYFLENVDVPVDSGFAVRAAITPAGVVLRWRAPSSPAAHVYYRVLRSHLVQPAFANGNGGIGDPSLPWGRAGIRCLPPTGGAIDCRIEMSYLGPTREQRFTDTTPLPPGAWTYRIGIAANWLDDERLGDMMVLSKPATIVVRHRL